MKHFFTYLLLCLVGVATAPLLGQTSNRSYTLLLQSGPEQWPENVASFIQKPDIQPNEVVQGRVYRLVQFYEIPTVAERRAMEQAGMVFELYIPHFAYLTSLPTSMDWNLLSSFGVRSIAPLAPMHKMHPELAYHNVPPHAALGDKIMIRGMISEQVPIQLVRSQLLQTGAYIESLSSAGRVVELALEFSQLDQVAALPGIQYLEFIPEPGEPEDRRQVSLHRSNVVNGNYPGASEFDGTGVSVVVRDNGSISRHIDFTGRQSETFSSSDAGTHGDAVSSVVGSAGNLDPTVQGMAPNSFLHKMDYVASFLDSTVHLHTNDGVMITNSSYSNGCNGGYTITTQTVDNQGNDFPSLLHVFSAGNSGTSNCNYGAGNTWGNITGGHKIGKNVIATASLNVSGNLVTSSSRGPSADGRLKPDISAMGASVVMTGPDNTYVTQSGTSFAAPAIAGVSAQLYQAYRQINGGSDPEGALIKAAMLNTAEDLGNPGPDYKHGFGMVHTGRALDLIRNKTYIEGTIMQDSLDLHAIPIPAGVKEARFMIYWKEEAATPLATKVLINDLDMEVQTPSSGNVQPLVLDPTPNATTLDQNAVPGIDTLNNVEQVVLLDPVAGTYTVEVDGKIVPEGTHDYYVLYTFLYDELDLIYPIGGESFVPGIPERIRWDAYGSAGGNFSLEFSANNGGSWTSIGSANAASRFFDWSVPDSITADARIRITQGSQTSTGMEKFNIIRQPQGLTIDQVCPDDLTFSWQAVPGATGYDVFLLGATVMDSIGTVPASSLSYTMSITDPDEEYWVSVRAIGPNGLIGRRAVAVNHPGGRVNCLIENDIAVENLLTVIGGPFQDCRTNISPIQIEITNLSPVTLSDIPVFYQYDNGAVNTDTITGTLSSGFSTNFTFSQITDFGAAGTHILRAWSVFPLDTINSNDTLAIFIEVEDGQTKDIAFIEDFESQTLCSTATNCEGEICPMDGGWINMTNGIDDNIDWRVNQGGTPSANTGPAEDHRPGNADGKYLYLEASGGCTEQVASLISPCIDLTGTTLPEMSFWYHMLGTDMGSLSIDVLSNGIWFEDIVPAIQGNQGSNWRNLEVDLSAYVGQLISIRFRGTTGTGFTSDMAIDDIAIYDRVGPPAIDFSSDVQVVCIDGAVNFTQTSLNNPDGFVWSFFPDNVTYLNGTTDTSANPTVSFPNSGVYSVQLLATNSFGADSLIRNSYIDVYNGELLDIVEDFEGGIFPTPNWSLINPSGIEWVLGTTVGPTGGLTTAAGLPLYGTGSLVPVEDYLESDLINLNGADQPILTFDVTYARVDGSSMDEVRVDISTDCGASFTPIYSKAGDSLATVSFFQIDWLPQEASHWRKDSVDLSAYVGESVVIRMVGISQLGISNNIGLDNILVEELGTAAPIANFASDVVVVCPGEPIVFSDMSIGNGISAYEWDFGADANPATATAIGPHSVSYSTGGLKFVTLAVSNGTDTTSVTKAIQVLESPIADYTVAILGLTFTFTNSSQNAGNYFWDFGDGNTSTDPNPVHTYEDFAEYTVSLVVTGPCGSDTISQSLVGIAEEISGAEVRVFPNPNAGAFSVEIEDPLFRSWKASLVDLQGRSILPISFESAGNLSSARILAEDLAEGMYMIRLQTDEVVLYRKVMLLK